MQRSAIECHELRPGGAELAHARTQHPTCVNVVTWHHVVAVGGHQLLWHAQYDLDVDVAAAAPNLGLQGRRAGLESQATTHWIHHAIVDPTQVVSQPPPMPPPPRAHSNAVAVEGAGREVPVVNADSLAEQEGAVVGDGDAVKVRQDVAPVQDLGVQLDRKGVGYVLQHVLWTCIQQGAKQSIGGQLGQTAPCWRARAARS